MEVKLQIFWSFLLCQDLIVNQCDSHSQNGKLGNIKFSCPQGQYFTGGFCIMSIDVEMDWYSAMVTCKRHGYELFWADDIDDYHDVDHLAPKSWTNYWSGLHINNETSRWTYESKEVSLNEVYWENGQPDKAQGICIYATKNGYFSFGNCLSKLPFICKSHAVLEGYFRCRNSKGIKTEFLCDGHNDCGDLSDESSCENSTIVCSEVIDAQNTISGSISSGDIVFNTSNSCYWIIVAGVGQTIKIMVKSNEMKNSTDILHFRTGGMDGDIYLGELTGSSVNSRPTYFSSDNIFTLRFITDNSVESSGFTIDWTTNVTEVFNGVMELIAESSTKELKSPFYDDGYLPHEKVLEWLITADTKNVVTLEFVDLKIGTSGLLYLWDGKEKTLEPTLNGVRRLKSNIFISKSSSVRLMLRSEGGGIAAFNKGLYIKYWEGCKVNHQLNEGMIQSPGFQSGSYPDKVDCQWTITTPENETRPISLRFNSFHIQSASDYLKVYNETNSTSAPLSPSHTGNGFTGSDDLTEMVFHSTSGIIIVEFQTNFVLTDKGFEAEFSVDCPVLDISSNAIMNSNEMYKTSFRSEVTLTCDTGYSFKQEEYNQMSAVTIRCEKGGKWNVSRIPDCMISYCSIPPNIKNGFISASSGVLYGANVTYECNDGFSMVGNNVIECLDSGKWSTAPTCQAERCPTLRSLDNGRNDTLEGDGTEFASVVQFTCNDGFELVGNLTIYCKTGGKWSHEMPICEKIWCPLPRIHDGSFDNTNDLRFEETVALTCESGYGINGTTKTSMVVTCGSDGLISIIPCMDIDECENSLDNCLKTEICINRRGSFICTCKDGFEKLPEQPHCTDIDECKLDPKPCENCTNAEPGYTCHCPLGYILYTEDGFNNISLAEGETGLLQGDVYRINHTCVRKQCPLPSDIPNGKVLTKKEHILYEDKVDYECNHGFITSDSTTLKCEWNGQYSSNPPVCSVVKCLKPLASEIDRAVEVYPKTVPRVDHGTEVNIECQYGSQMINRTLYCSYNVMTGQYEMMGDAAECPEIDCGDPEKVPGSSYKGRHGNGIQSTFTFDCEDGFTLKGKSLDGTNTVTCEENGRWNLGNLTCLGGRCSDPGTPGGAFQDVKSYEVGELLFFRCNNSGYYPSPPEPFKCIVDHGDVKWNTTVLPECEDTTPPKFTNCSTDPIYIDKSESYTYTVPTATDNSGSVKSISNLSPDRGPGKNTNDDISIVYQAEDYSGNIANCTIQIKIKDYAKQILKCPSSYPYNTKLIDTADGITYNVTDSVTVTNDREDIVLQYNPSELISLDHTDIGNPQIVEVTATDKWGGQDKCRFHLETSAAACFKESFPNVQHANESCTSGNVSCTLTCDTGYILFDGNSSRTYNCEGENIWTPALPPQYACIAYDEPAYLIEFMLVYTTVASSSGRQFAFNCVKGLEHLLLNDLKATLTSEILSVCNHLEVGKIEISDVQSNTNSFEMLTVFTVKFLDTAVPEKNKDTCGSNLELFVTKLTFLNFNDSVTCESGSTMVDRKDSPDNKMIRKGNICAAGIQKVTDIEEKCIKCQPGTFSSGGDVPVCVDCPEGKFQDLDGQPSCKTCHNRTHVPSEDKTSCLALCPAGFISDDGLPNCRPCPENTYWVNSTHCESCPDDGQTLGFDGVSDKSGCKLPCETGQYSVTGYVPCKLCPVHFYQDVIGQDMCKECRADQITQTTGSKNLSDCIDLGTLDYCNNTSCNGHGQCIYDGHGTVCKCEPGYFGEVCDEELNPCFSSPCWNGGICAKTGYNTYNCSCPVDTSCKMVSEANRVGNDADVERDNKQTRSQPNLEACEQFCLNSLNCMSVHYTEGHCFVFNKPTTTTAKTSSIYSLKQCSDTKLFGNHRCEDDLINSCKNDTCSEHGMCQDLLGDEARCLCPLTGEFTGNKCEKDTDLCNPDPCDNGTCVSYGSVRYQCICEPGYTGKDCDFNINECSANPKGCLYNGTCVDKVNDYECSCKQGFHGDRCKDVPDFCSSNPCPEGICYGDYDEFEFTCKCEEPHRLAADGTCEMIPPCEGVECVNGTCGGDGKCDCAPGFEGSLCQHNIDDCKSRPCQHRGQCTDLLNDYECDCPLGYGGKNCENNTYDCIGVCTDSNVEKCEDLVNDYRCICKPGYTGRNCTDDIDECRSFPCRHSGKCTDSENDFSCECPQGWTGKQCELPEDFCRSSPCLNQGLCYNMTDGFFCRCQGGTKGDTCEDFPDVCNVTKPCTNGAHCNNVGGTAECSCTDDYDGSSCHLINYQCGDADTCKNDGKCSTKDKGFQCVCPDSFSGTTCDTYTDPCSSNPCHSSAKCISEKHRHICYCRNGGYLTDSGCQDMDDNFDLYMDSEIADSPGFLRTPLVMPNNSDMTVMFWFRVIGYGSTLLTLEPVGISYPWPLFQTSIVKILTNKMIVNFTAVEEIAYGQDKADGIWHFFVLSWERNGNTKVFIDSISVFHKMTVSAEQLPQMLQVIFGSSETNGRISKLMIYRTVFSDVDISKSMQNLDHLASKKNELVQIWANLAFTRSTFPKYPSQVHEDVCDKGFSLCPADRTKPKVTNCPDDKFETGEKTKLTVLAGLKSLATFSDVTKVNSSINDDEVYTFGRTNEVVVGYDDAMNYAICRFKIYIKYFDECPTPDTDASIDRCKNNQSVCGLSCASGNSLSIDHRNTYTCGRLGVFNYQHPWKQFVLPTCGGKTTQNIALTVTMKYTFIINCMTILKDELNNELVVALENVKNSWSDISCMNGTCEVTTSCINEGSSPEVNAELTISGLRPTTTKEGKTYTMREAMLIIILQEYLLSTDDIKGVGQADLLDNTVMVTVSPSCPSGYVVLGDTCVQCGKGTYRNDTTMTCEFCPVGTYQVLSGQTTCQPCIEGKTTLTYGSYLSADCVDDCQPGKFYDTNTKRCTDCPKDNYQDMSGQEFCHRCPLGFKTSGKGSNSSTICYADCEAGKELQPDGKCKSCSRGYYRTQNDDKCVSCGDIYTTEGEGTKSLDDCNIRICTAGNFRNSFNVCVPCPVGEYQSEDLEDKCNECPHSYTTDGEGKTHKDNCTFYCPAGEEVDPAKQKSCRPCPRGSYRSIEPDQILMPCINCSDGNTTESEKSESSDQCTIRRCKAGQIIDIRGECKDCPIDTYQHDDMPTSSTKCEPCSPQNTSPQKGTMGSGTANQDDCAVICKEGEQNDGGSCSPCPQGTWSSGNNTMRFQMCTNCSDLWTTKGQGSTHPDNCTLRDCDPGYYIDGNDCIACGFAQYQPNRHAVSCRDCAPNQNTTTIASTQQSACQIYCKAGEYGTDTCQPCEINSIKPSEGMAECEECTGNTTSNDARTACSELFCVYGLYNMNGECVPCDIGEYKDKRGNAESCEKCGQGYTTAGVGSGSKDDCYPLNCDPGKFQNYTSNRCEPCPVKTYNSQFNGSCTECDDDKTTPGTGSTSKDDCSLVYCSPGQKRTSKSLCEDCPIGYYQQDYGKTDCESCEAGYTTSDMKTKNQSECHEMCPKGFQFNTRTKLCEGCPLGYYKEAVGNNEQCLGCPGGNTTANVNSTSEADCNISDCQAGSKRDLGGCTLCVKGTYQHENSSTSCHNCGANRTTENTGSKKVEECIGKCDPGEEYNLVTKACEPCSVGFHTVRPTTEKCVQCPPGTTTLDGGANVCVENKATSSPPIKSSLKITYRYTARFECSNLAQNRDNFILHMKEKIIARLNVLAVTYQGICSEGGCKVSMQIDIKLKSNSCSAIAVKRNRRAVIEQDLSFEVTIPNVSTTVNNSNTNNVRPIASVLQEDVTNNLDEYNPLPGSFKPENATVQQIVECGEGMVANKLNCEPCPKGTKKSSTGTECVDCPLNYYQDSEGQNNCKQCTGVKKYTLATKSTSELSCVSACEKNPGYCNNRGTCQDDKISAYCSCNDGYEGSRCESRASSTRSIIGGAIGGSAVLLLAIFIIVLVCRKCYPSEKDGADEQRFKQLEDFDTVDYFNPMYMYAYGRPHPTNALKFEEELDPGHNPYQPYITQNQARVYESNSYYSASPRGWHEWHATSE